MPVKKRRPARRGTKNAVTGAKKAVKKRTLPALDLEPLPEPVTLPVPEPPPSTAPPGQQKTGQAPWTGDRARGMIDALRWNRPKKPTLEELRDLLMKEGLESELYSDPPKMKYGRHKHPFDDFVVIVSGKMKIATDTHEWVLKVGDRIDLPANTYHTAEMLGKEEVRWLSAAK